MKENIALCAVPFTTFNSIKDYPRRHCDTRPERPSSFNSIKDYPASLFFLVSSVCKPLSIPSRIIKMKIVVVGNSRYEILSIPSRIISTPIMYTPKYGGETSFNSIKDYLGVPFALSLFGGKGFQFHQGLSFYDTGQTGIVRSLSIPSRII